MCLALCHCFSITVLERGRDFPNTCKWWEAELDSGSLHRMSFEQSPLPLPDPITTSFLVPLLPASSSLGLCRWRAAEQAGALGATQV